MSEVRVGRGLRVEDARLNLLKTCAGCRTGQNIHATLQRQESSLGTIRVVISKRHAPQKQALDVVDAP